ncbi:hypothetical protein MMC11_006081 [Xylographa trunciseda]|nr:hypothetical protein [Xylographa trunciseda]
MDANDVIVKNEFSAVQDTRTRMTGDKTSEDHGPLSKLANEASYLVLIRQVGNSLAPGSVGYPNLGDKTLGSVSLEYSAMAYAEAFMYRLEKYGMICSIISQPPKTSVPQAVREQTKVLNRNQAGCSTSNPLTLPSAIPQGRTTPTPDTSDDECVVVSSRQIKPSKESSYSASRLSTNATSTPSASTKNEPHSGSSRSLNTVSMLQPLIDAETSIEPDVGPPAPAAPQTSTAQIVPAPRKKHADTSAPISTAQQRYLLSGIQRLSNRQEATYFAQPVSFNHMRLLSIPHYPDIIKKPMDLRTMEEKLKFGKYTCVDQYVSDIDQMVENSVIFNGRRHEVTKDGYALKASLDTQIRNSFSADTTKGPIHISSSTPRQPGRPRKWRNLEKEMGRSRSTKRGRESSEVSEYTRPTCKTDDTTTTSKADDRSSKRKKPIRQAAINGAENLKLLATPTNTD